MYQVFKAINGTAVPIGQQRKRRDARHQARMVRIVINAPSREVQLKAVHNDYQHERRDTRSSLDMFI